MFNEKRSNNGFTIVELVVVMTIIGILASSAVFAYNKVVNDAKATKNREVASALGHAKALFMLDPGTTAQDVSDFNADPDRNFDKIAPYRRSTESGDETISEPLIEDCVVAPAHPLGRENHQFPTPDMVNHPDRILCRVYLGYLFFEK